MKNHPVGITLSVLILMLVAALPALAVSAPALLAPAAGASLPEPLTISWSAVSDPSGIIGYNWQVSASSSFSSLMAQNSTDGQTTEATVSGLPNGTYFWRVQSVNSGLVQSAWSAGRSFTVSGAGTGQPGTPALSPTKAYSTFHPLEVMTFNWSTVPGAASYVLQFSQDPSFPIATSGKFDNIPNPTFSFSTPDQGVYSARVYAVNANGVAGIPSNVITFSVFYNNPITASPSIVSPASGTTLSLPLTLAWTDSPNPQPSGYELQIAKDSNFSTIESDEPQLNNATRTELSLSAGQKFWRVRSFQGDSSPNAPAVTAWSAAGTFTINPAPAAPVSIVATSNPIFSGNNAFLQLQLSGAAPAGGSVINLTSSNPAALSVPATVNMPGNTAWMQFQIQAGQVTASTPVTITATLNSGNAELPITVLPPSLKSISISPSVVSGGAPSGATIVLNGLAPAGGASINLTSDSPAVLAPAVVTIPAGNSTAAVPVPTSSVPANTIANITANWNGASVKSQLTLTPQGQPATFSLSSSAVSGGGGSTGIVTLAAASTNDQFFQVASSNANVAQVPSSVMIFAGSTSGTFNINTVGVGAQTLVTISVTGGGVTRSATLTVNAFVKPTTTSLAVTAGGRAGERVISTPAGINVATGTTQTAQFAPGTVITLSVASGRDVIWSGACTSNGAKTRTCKLTLNANSPVTAKVQ
jgi:hypothetical protein